MLWIDGVGGYLVCSADRVVIGHATGERVDLPLLAEVSPRHATIRRHGDAYLLERYGTSAGPVRLDGRPVGVAQVLHDGGMIELGGGDHLVRLRFTQRHPWSASARLDFLSRHRTSPWCDSVLLLADTLILGPGRSSHVRCPDWERDVMLVRQQERLNMSYRGHYTVNGRAVEGATALGEEARVGGDRWSFAVESFRGDSATG